MEFGVFGDLLYLGFSRIWLIWWFAIVSAWLSLGFACFGFWILFGVCGDFGVSWSDLPVGLI